MRKDASGRRRRRRRSRWLTALVAAAIVLALPALLVSGIVLYFGGVVPAKNYFITNYHDEYLRFKKWVMESDVELDSAASDLRLPVFDLALSRSDVAHFADIYSKFEDPRFGDAYYAAHNRWRSAKMRFDGVKWKIKIKSHGKSPNDHRNGRFISYGVKMPRGRCVYNAHRFEFIIRERVLPERLRTFILAKKLGLLFQPERLVRLNINGAGKLYYFEHRLDDAYLEVLGRSSYRIFTDDNDFSMVYADRASKEEMEGFRAGMEAALAPLGLPPSHVSAITDRYDALNKAIAYGGASSVASFFDKDYIASYIAETWLNGYVQGHGFCRGNLYVFLDTASGKFYPAFTRDNIVDKLSDPGDGSVERQVVCFKNGDVRFPLFAKLAADDETRWLAYKKVYPFVRDGGEALAKEAWSALERVEKTHLFGVLRLIADDMGLRAYSRATLNNAAIIKSYLEKSSPKVEWAVDGGALWVSVLPRSMAPLSFTSLRIMAEFMGKGDKSAVDVFSSTDGGVWSHVASFDLTISDAGALDVGAALSRVEMSTALDNEARKRRRRYLFRLDGFARDGKGDVAAVLKNRISGSSIFAPVSRMESVPDMAGAIEKRVAKRTAGARFVKEYADIAKFYIKEDEIRLCAGDYRITRDVIIPDGYKLVFEAGAVLRLGENVVIYAPNGLDVRGSGKSPVVVDSMSSDKRFGALCVLGDGKTTTSDIKYLQLRRGNEAWHRGAYFSGALSIHYNASVSISHSSISECAADDGVNLKYIGELNLEDSDFVNNAFDQLDLDYVKKGAIVRCRFQGGGVNGDGLDVSGSRLDVEGCVFRNSIDKALSVGERSRLLVSGCDFRGNKLGIAVKDLSETFVDGCVFGGNKTDVAAYRKKNIWGGGTVYLGGNTPGELKITSDKESEALRFVPGDCSKGAL